MAKRRNPILDRLRDSGVKNPVHSEIDVGTTTTARLAFCPLLKEHDANGRMLCGYVDCGNCRLLQHRLEETDQEHWWLCTNCVEDSGLKPEGYWTDGECEDCGKPSWVLQLSLPRG